MRTFVFRPLAFFLPRVLLWGPAHHWRDEALDAMNKNTRRAYVGALRRFMAWLGWRWPTDAEFARYIEWLVDAGRGASTVRQAVSAVRCHARHHRGCDPTGPLTAAAVKRAKLAAADRGRGQAPAATPEEVRTLMGGRTGRNRPSLNALIALLYMGALRVSEAAALRWEDVVALDGGRAANVWVRRSKCNPYGADSDVRHLKGDLAEALLLWLDASFGGERGAGPVFGGVTAGTLSRRVKKAVREAGLARCLTAHSFRAGLAAELTRRGASLQEVMHAGGWKSPAMAAHYSAAARAEGGAVAKYM